jgi:hypothetical protein
VNEIKPAAAGHEDVLANPARWSTALRLLRDALRELDEANAPTEIGAQLDGVINRLERAIHKSVQRRG